MPEAAPARVVHLQLADAAGWRAVEEVTALAGEGLESDKHVRRSRRQVLLVEQEVLEEFGLAPGALHEQITVTGLRLASLAAGCRLQVGEAVFEITIPCQPCNFVNSFGEGMIERLRGRRGILARVVEGGRVRRGDEIRRLGDGNASLSGPTRRGEI